MVMNRHKIAKICWEKLDLPVRSALVACKLYREMAKKPFVRREVSLEMEENANDFEKMATEVRSKLPTCHHRCGAVCDGSILGWSIELVHRTRLNGEAGR